MNVRSDYISLGEAAEYAGVSIDTLLRFADTGHLHVEEDSSGLRYFSRMELGNLFRLSQVASAENLNWKNLGNSSKHEKVIDIELSKDSAQGKSDIELDDDISKSSKPINSDEFQEASPGTVPQFERENIELKSKLTVHEMMLSMKEVEVSDLKSQVQWLRKRIENLEEKNERDQIILLSETQSLRKLIQSYENRRFSMKYALEWLGFVKPTSSQGETIEVKSSNTSEEGSKKDPQE